MKRKVALYAAAVVLPIALFWGLGFLMPPKFEIAQDGDVQAPADVVFETLTTEDGLAAWAMWAKDAGMEGLTGAPLPGDAVGWTWSLDGEPFGTMTVREATPDTEVLYDVDYRGRAIERRLVLTAAGATTSVHWSDAAWVGNPAERWLGLFMDDAVRADIAAAIDAIDAAARDRWHNRSKVSE